MDHLDELRLLDLLREPPTTREAGHLAGCPRCRRELESLRATLSELGELDSQELSEGEIHSLRVLFRQLGPSRRRWIAELVPPLTAPAQAPATRGPLTASLAQYHAGEVTIILHVTPSRRRGHYELHGTIQGETQQPVEGTPVVLSSSEGFTNLAEADRLGEFHFHGVPRGSYHVNCMLGRGHVEVQDLAVGETGGDSGA